MTEEQAEKLIKENERLRAEIVELKADLQLQKDLVAELLKRLYGSSSEKMSTDQLLLDFLKDGVPKKPDAAGGLEQPAANKAPAKTTPRTQRLKESMKQLPSITREIIPDEVAADPENYRRIGEEVSERLHVKPSAFTRHVTVRPTYVKKGDLDGAPLTAALEPTLLPGSVLTPSLGAWLLTEKFCYHQPFQRLEWRLKHAHGIELSRSMMCHWHNHLAELLQPLYNIIAADIRSSDYVQVDEPSGAR